MSENMINIEDTISNSLIGNEMATASILGSLTKEQKIKILASLHGFERLPPTIDEFIEDDYFLGRFLGNGRLFPFWKEHLKDIFPDPIRSPYFILNFGGALGIGKSVNSMVCALYTIAKLAYLKDPAETFGLERGVTPYTIRAFNLDKTRALSVLVNPIKERLAGMPFFQEYQKNNNGNLPCKLKIEAAKKASDIISECCLFSLISEVNFFKPEIAKDIITTSISRMASRLQKVKGVFGTIILDSSATGKDAVVEEFLRNDIYTSQTKIVRAAIWDVKPNEYFREGSFEVYAGSAEINPHILVPGEDRSKLDLDRIVVAPKELYREFKNDIEKTLKDQAGVSLDSFSDFFSNKEVLANCFQIENEIENVMEIDFFDDEQIQDRIGYKILEVLPKHRKIYARIDLGISNDLCGIAIGHIDEIKWRDIDGRKVLQPKISIPIAFGLGRFQGQETSIHKIENFLVWLDKHFDVALITTDQYQSTGIRQTLTENMIQNKLLSVDRTDVPYVQFKNLVTLGEVKLVKNDLLREELFYLQRINEKVDHLKEYSKDISDAVCGVVYSILSDGESACDIPTKNKFNNYSNGLKELINRGSRNSGNLHLDRDKQDNRVRVKVRI